MGPFAFALVGDGTETLELDIYSVIGESFWFESVSANNVRRRLKDSKAQLIRTRIHSSGGDVFDAQAIYSLLKEHPARVEVQIDGLAASAATLIAMAGDEISIAEGGWFMIHNPWGMATGESDELRSWADVLDKMRDSFAGVYATRSGQSRAKVLELMAAETWMTAAEALALGFVDKVLPARAKPAAAAGANANRGAFRALALAIAEGHHPNVPEALRRRVTASPEPPPAPQLSLPLEQQEPNPMTFPKSLYAALNLVEGADEQSVLAAINKAQARASLFARIAALAGVAATDPDDGVLGTVKAWKTSHDDLPGVRAKLSETQAASQVAELDALIKTGRDEHKLTKAAADELKGRVEGYFKAKAEKREPTEEEWSLSQARSYVKNLSVQAHLAGTGGGESPAPGVGGGKGSPAAAATWNGKAYEQLTGTESAELERDDEELYAKMRKDWQQRGEPEFKAPAAA